MPLAPGGTPRQSPLQHCPSAVHAALGAKQVAASTTLGAVIEVTNGKATAAAMPAFLIKSRRDSLGEPDSRNVAASIKWARCNCLIANQTASSSRGLPDAL